MSGVDVKRGENDVRGPFRRRPKVLMSAFYCRPGLGSEEGIGWDLAREMAEYCDVWVLTRANNRERVEASLADKPGHGVRFVYYDLPHWISRWARGQMLEWHVYYYLWQACVYFVARGLHRRVGFDLIHHVTFAKYWIPSFLALLPVPFVWGPVGGGESAPRAFWHDFGLRGKVYELLRDGGRWTLERDPFLRLTARRSALARATTEETAARMRKLGAEKTQVFSAIGLPEEEIKRFGSRDTKDGSPVRLISIGRLLHLKGFHLGLRAYAEAMEEAELPVETEYWIVGDGPERERLEALAKKLKVAGKVRFWGALSREETLDKLEECDVLIHPSLHDSGGYVCLEAMAAGCPVVCLDVGGPAVQITEETGFEVKAVKPAQVVRDLADVIARLVGDRDLRNSMGEAGRKRAKEVFDWKAKAIRWVHLYRDILEGP